MNQGQFVLVTTDHNNRGVFAGVFESQTGTTVYLTAARMVIYWDQSTHGVVGLAKNGPGPACRISPAAPEIELAKVTCVMACTDEAVVEFLKEPWG